MPRKGVADELLAKKEKERGRRSSRDDSRPARNRSYSASSASDSISTISTNRSPSRSLSPERRKRGAKGSIRGGADADDALGKRGRSVSSDSDTSPDGRERNVRRRMSSFSPPQRGRSRRSGSGRRRLPQDRSTSRRRGRRRSHSRHSDRMDTSDESLREPPGLRTLEHAPVRRSPRHVHHAADSRSQSPHARGRPKRSSYRSHSRSLSPGVKRREFSRSPSPYNSRNGGTGPRAPRGAPESHNGRGSRFDQRPPVQAQPPAPLPPRERSLSPYSKRVALTRQMQG